MRLRTPLGIACALLLLAGCGSSPAAAPPHRREPANAGQKTGSAPAPVTTPSAPAAPSTGLGAAPPAPSSPSGQVTTPQIPDTGSVVNGCDPAKMNPQGPFGMCLDGLPQYRCQCSAAGMEWSDIYVGMTVDIKGAVPIDPATGSPQSSAVVLLGPDGKRTDIPVARSGAFAQDIAFTRPGTYRLGVLYQGTPTNLQAFEVGWLYKVVEGGTLGTLFPFALHGWGANAVLLTAPIGSPGTWEIELENARGQPQPGARLTPTGPVANARGIVTLHAAAIDQFGSPYGVATGLYVQPYVDLVPGPAGLSGFPAFAASRPLPTTGPLRVTKGGVAYYDVEDVLTEAGAGVAASGFTYDPATGVFTVNDGNSGTGVQVSTASGAVREEHVSGDPATVTWTAAGTVHALVQSGQVYLAMPDLITLARAVAWGAPDGHGGMLFSEAWLW